jgi:hypothetical protein
LTSLDKPDRSFATSVDKLCLSRSLSTGKQTKFAKPAFFLSFAFDEVKLFFDCVEKQKKREAKKKKIIRLRQKKTGRFYLKVEF